MNNDTLMRVARNTVKANEVREASYIQGKFRYRLDCYTAAAQVLDAEGVTDKAERMLVGFLTASGEGVDVCRDMLKAMSVQA